MRSLIVTVASLALTAGVLTNAYLHKQQFYPSVVYITKSSPSMAILYLQVCQVAAVIVILSSIIISLVCLSTATSWVFICRIYVVPIHEANIQQFLS